MSASLFCEAIEGTWTYTSVAAVARTTTRSGAISPVNGKVSNRAVWAVTLGLVSCASCLVTKNTYAVLISSTALRKVSKGENIGHRVRDTDAGIRRRDAVRGAPRCHCAGAQQQNIENKNRGLHVGGDMTVDVDVDIVCKAV